MHRHPLTLGLILAFAVLGAATSSPQTDPPDPQQTQVQPDPDPIAAPPAPSGPIDAAWAPIVARTGPRPEVTAYRAGTGPRFLMFGASWCPGCVAATPQDAALARRYGSRMQIGLAIHGEEDATFRRSDMATWFSGLTVWSASSTRDIGERCGVSAIPAACLVDGDRVLWHAVGAGDGVAIIDAYFAGTLDSVTSRLDSATAEAPQAPNDPQVRNRVLAGLHGFAGQENNISWGLVDRPVVSPAEASFAVALARDAVDATAGLDHAILDTLAVALHKNGQDADAGRVGARVIAVCDALHAECGEERDRAEEYIRIARGS
jgi:hypothetical protein